MNKWIRADLSLKHEARRNWNKIIKRIKEKTGQPEFSNQQKYPSTIRAK